MNDIFNNYDKGELSQNFKDSMNYNIYLDGLEKRNFDSEKDKTVETTENRLADSLESLATLLTMNKAAEMDASMVIDKKEENSISSNSSEKEPSTPSANAGSGSSSDDKPSHTEHPVNTPAQINNTTNKLLEELDSLFTFKVKYAAVDSMKDANKGQADALIRFKTYLNSVFSDMNELLKYLISYKKRNTLSINEYEIVLFIYSNPNAYKYILDQDDRFGLKKYIFDRKITENGEPIWNETQLKYIYKDLEKRYNKTIS